MVIVLPVPVTKKLLVPQFNLPLICEDALMKEHVTADAETAVPVTYEQLKVVIVLRVALLY